MNQRKVLEHYAKSALELPSADDVIKLGAERFGARFKNLNSHASKMLRAIIVSMHESATTTKQYLFALSVAPSADQPGKVSWADPKQPSSLFTDQKPTNAYIKAGNYSVRNKLRRKRGTLAQLLKVWQDLGGKTITYDDLSDAAALSERYLVYSSGNILGAYPVTITSGDDIVTVYTQGQSKSCVTENINDILDFYANNPDTVHIAYFGNLSKSAGRFLLWQYRPGEWYMDRMYHGSAPVIELYRDTISAAIRKDGHFMLNGYKITNYIAANSYDTDPKFSFDERIRMDVTGLTHLPYMDTFNRFVMDGYDAVLLHYSKGDYAATTPDGGALIPGRDAADDDDYVTCEHSRCNHTAHTDDMYYVEDSGGWYCSDHVVWCARRDVWLYDGDAVSYYVNELSEDWETENWVERNCTYISEVGWVEDDQVTSVYIGDGDMEPVANWQLGNYTLTDDGQYYDTDCVIPVIVDDDGNTEYRPSWDGDTVELDDHDAEMYRTVYGCEPSSRYLDSDYWDTVYNKYQELEEVSDEG